MNGCRSNIGDCRGLRLFGALIIIQQSGRATEQNVIGIPIKPPDEEFPCYEHKQESRTLVEMNIQIENDVLTYDDQRDSLSEDHPPKFKRKHKKLKPGQMLNRHQRKLV